MAPDTAAKFETVLVARTVNPALSQIPDPVPAADILELMVAVER